MSAPGPEGQCRHAAELAKLTHDSTEHRVYGTCEACEMAAPVRCSCGYDACCGIDFDEHVVASMHTREDHHAR